MSVLLSMEFEGLPPTVNHLYENSHGRRYKTSEGWRYQKQISAALAKCWHSRPVYKAPVELRIFFITNNKRRWDIDNRVKALQDCLSMAGIIEDDKQVNVLHVERKYGKEIKTCIEVSTDEKLGL